ncbi:Sporulation related domain-containing protein [Lishizhenia tianjinensis]|uniref:Sporulation related domain-containing protein n=1 Tax=Lishizhenia tianjinensis TaxID=477690 RepID=A0A1I7BDK2_9FLAO|nr:SPOR domain-containing protein [Lishizhenia tianjinensis]SFT85270.1 Sporulation related domain-containing protein [Lishizhenia tianjinensis]
MKQVNEAIAELLLRHNCVIIPNFGGFIANVLNAQIDLNQGRIEAPKKALTFNTNLINNDGLLANYMANKNQWSFEQASTTIQEEVVTWKQQLKQGERVEIERVGFLYFDKEQNLNFEQDRFFNLLLSSYGLSDVNFVQPAKEEKTAPALTAVKAIEEEKEEKTPIISIGKAEEIRTVAEQEVEQPTKRKRAFWKYAAAAAFIPVAFYSYWIPTQTDVLQSGVVLKGDFNPFVQPELKQYDPANSPVLEVERLAPEKSLEEIMNELPEGVETYTFPVDDYFYLTVKKESTETIPTQVEKVEEVSTPVAKEESVATTYSRHLIAGCFTEKENAESLVNALKNDGLNAFVLDYHKGLYRVSAAQSNDREEALALKKKLQGSGVITWLLHL